VVSKDLNGVILAVSYLEHRLELADGGLAGLSCCSSARSRLGPRRLASVPTPLLALDAQSASACEVIRWSDIFGGVNAACPNTKETDERPAEELGLTHKSRGGR